MFGALLAEVPHDIDLWEASAEHLEPAYALYRRIRMLDGVGPTRTSKLMARKRPRLIPIVDKTIRSGLSMDKTDDSWLLIAAAFREDPELISLIDGLRPIGIDECIPTLRVLDAGLWMNLSNSRHVRPLREQATLAARS